MNILFLTSRFLIAQLNEQMPEPVLFASPPRPFARRSLRLLRFVGVPFIGLICRIILNSFFIRTFRPVELRQQVLAAACVADENHFALPFFSEFRFGALQVNVSGKNDRHIGCGQ